MGPKQVVAKATTSEGAGCRGADVEPGTEAEQVSRVFRWDMDKTYLRTEFDSPRDLLKLAFESAADKRTIPGAAVLLRELCASKPLGVYIISGSPEQLRRVLEAKLRLDGIHWDGFTLKPQLKALLRGRFRFIKDQVGYKLGALLESRAGLPAFADEYMFGDDAEADAFIYSIYSDLCAGRVDASTFLAVLRQAQVYEEDLPNLMRLASRLPKHDGLQRIFIHLDRVSSPAVFEEFGRRVCPFYNYLQPALVLLEAGALTPLGVLRVAAQLLIHHGFTPDALAASYMDLLERDHIGAYPAQQLLSTLEGIEESHFATTYRHLRTFAESLSDSLEDVPLKASPLETPDIDYVSLFSKDKARARRARARVTR